MLPDFPETKLLFGKFFRNYMRRKMRELSPFGMVQIHYLHEGRGMKMVRADESESDSQVQQFSSEMQMRFDEIPELTLDKVIKKFDAVILDMLKQQTGFTAERLDAEIPKSNTVDAKGRKLDAALIIEMYRTIELEFYADGTPHELHTVGPLFTAEAHQRIEEEFRNNPDLQKQLDNVIEEKREKWRAREADRKLVG